MCTGGNIDMKAKSINPKGESDYNRKLLNNGSCARLLAAIVTAVMVSVPVFAAGFVFAETGASVTSTSRVLLTGSQEDFIVPVSIEKADAYAGVELAVQCGEGVTVESVSYNRSGSHAGPTEARGLVWFSAFSGANVFTDELIADVHMHYSGEGNTSVVIDHAAFHTVEGGAFRTENAPLRKVITIGREGAGNTPPVLYPPEESGTPGGGNPPSGNAVTEMTNTAEPNAEVPDAAGPDAAVPDAADTDAAVPAEADAKAAGGKADKAKADAKADKDTKTGGSEKPAKKTSSQSTQSTAGGGTTNDPSATNAPAGLSPASGAGTQSAIVADGSSGISSGVDPGLNEQIPSGDIGEPASISSSEVPLAGGNATTTTGTKGNDALNTALLVMALACFAAFVFVTVLFIKRRRDEEKRKDEASEMVKKDL
jgi:hypothetical protein